MTIVAGIIFHTDFFAKRTSTMFSRYLFRGTGYTLEFRAISGNPLERIKIEDLRIRYRSSEYAFDLLRVEEIFLSYDLASLFSTEPSINEIIFNRPHAWIKPDSTGENILPFNGTSTGRSGQVRFRVEKFDINNGQLIYQGNQRADALKNLNLEGAVRSGEKGIIADIGSGSAEDIRRKLHIRNISGNIRKNSGSRSPVDRIEVSDLFLELDESSLLINGTFDPDSTRFGLNIAAEPFDVEEISRLVGIESGQFGELQGVLAVEGTTGDLKIRGMLNGILSGFALDGFKLDLRYDTRAVMLNSGEGRLNGALVNGSGVMPVSGERIIKLDLDVNDLDLSAGFIRNNSIPDTRFNGMLILRYDVDSKELYFTMDLKEGHLRKIPFSTMTASGSYRADTLFMDQMTMAYPTHDISTTGTISRDGGIRLFIDTECAKDDTLFSYFNIDEYRANLKFNGIWEGSFARWDLRASGCCTDIFYKGAYVPSGDIKFALSRDESFRFLFEMRGDSCDIAPLSFSGIDLSLEYNDNITSIKRLYLQRPGLVADMRGDLIKNEDITEIVFNEVSIDALEERWLSNGKFSVNISESRIEFDDLQLHSRLGALYMGCVVGREDRRINGNFTFDRLGLSLFNAAGLINKPVTGKGAGVINCRGTIDQPGFDLDMVLEQMIYDSLSVDSLKLVANYSDRIFEIDTLYIDSPEGILEMKGTVSGTDPRELLKGREKALRGAVADLDAVCEDLSLVPLFSLSEKSPFSGGDFTGIISVRDSLTHPLLGVEGKISGLSTDRYRIPMIDISADIDRQSLKLDGIMELSQGQRGRFNGNINLNHEKWFYSIDQHEPISVGLSIPDGELSSITGMTDIIAEAEGRFSAEFTVTGTASEPKLRGRLDLDQAGFRLGGMEERYRGIRAVITLDDTLVTIRELHGKEGKNGNFNCVGSVSLKGWRPERYDIDIEVDKILIASIPDVMAIVSGNLAVGTTESGGKKIPVVTGDLSVNRAEVYIDFGDFASVQKSGSLEPPGWMAEVDLEVKGNTWLKTPDANVEMEGAVTLHHDQKGSYVRGSLNLIRGWYNVYNNKFRVSSGKLEFVHADSFRPVIDVQAETNDPEGRKIYLTLSWHQDDIEPRLSLYHEDAGYSETDIWKMLGGGVIGTSEGAGASWDAMNTAQNLAANYIERMLNSQMQGVLIEVETSGGASSATEGFEPEETIVAIGKYLSEGLYVKYKQGLSISTARHFEVEYRLSRLFLIRSEVIMYSEKVLQGRSKRNSDEINVDFKVRWEF